LATNQGVGSSNLSGRAKIHVGLFRRNEVYPEAPNAAQTI
jgi:hypothetical protein